MSDTIGLVTFIGFILLLFFVFSGEPDLWDKWHAAAMRAAEPAKLECPANSLK